MSDSVLNQTCLVLNKAWEVINAIPVRAAVSQLASGAVTALDIHGEEYIVPVTWEQWIELPIRECDTFIATAKRRVRAPTVVAAVAYAKMPKKRWKLGIKDVAKRDNFTCQYCGKTLPIRMLNLDHVIPRRLEGETTWENIVTSCIPCNSYKGGRTPEQAGMKLARKPFEPKPVPVSKIIAPEHPHHRIFV